MVGRLIGLEEARDLFLSQFSHHEIERLRAFLMPVNTQPIAPSSFPGLRQFQKMNNLIFGTPELYGVCFGASGMRYDLHPLINEIPVLKKIINAAIPKAVPTVVKARECSDAQKKIPVIENPELADSENLSRPEKFPEWPQRLEISHPNLGSRIPVTRHAWERFCERYTRSVPWRKGWDYSQGFFKGRIRELFRAAPEEDMSQVGVIRRLVDNNFVPARYFLNKEINLRFIISEADKTLLTVETPTQSSLKWSRLDQQP